MRRKKIRFYKNNLMERNPIKNRLHLLLRLHKVILFLQKTLLKVIIQK